MAMKLRLFFYSPLQLAVGGHGTKSQSMSCGQMVRAHSSSAFNGRVSPYKLKVRGDSDAMPQQLQTRKQNHDCPQPTMF